MNGKSPLEKSLDLATNKFVSACAGAGKTFALSKRYCKILDDFTKRNAEKTKDNWLGVKNILVITFTRKAADEMASRIYHDLNTLLNGKKIPELENQGIELGENIINAGEDYKLWLRSTFSQNYISTIDGFCGRILRENAHLINIDPKFQTSDETQSKQIFDETLDEFLREKSDKFDKNLEILLENISLNFLKQYLNYLYSHRATVSDWIRFTEENSREEIFRTWTNLYTPEIEIENLLEKLRLIANYSENYAAPTNDKGQIKFLKLQEKLAELSAIREKKEKQKFIITEILMPIFQTGSGTYYSSNSTRIPWQKKYWTEEEIYRDFKEYFLAFMNYLREKFPETEIGKTPNEYDYRAIPVLKALVALYREFYLLLEQKQKELNFLNFEDIILKTYELLQKFPEIAKKYSRQFKHIMVDEFQDTNDLRWNIIKLIGKENSEFSGNLRKSGIFIVGDKKQSIYRFNQADVQVMNRAENELTNGGKSNEIIISFNDNFRSSEEYINFVINPIFEKILPPNSDTLKPFEAYFEATNFNENNTSEKQIAELTETICTIRTTFSKETEFKQNPGYASALNAAFAVKEFLDWAEKTGLTEKVVVGVLLRKFTNIQNYLKVFREHEIPFEIIGGRELFQQQETIDLFHFVSVLLNPFDDLALAGLLRSPFFACSDAEIHKLKNRNKNESIFSYLKRTEEFEEIARLIEKWRNMATNRPIDILLENILSEDLRELGYFSELGGLQRIANIDKILSVIHNLALTGSDLQNVFAFLNFQIKSNHDTSQADYPSEAKVQIMSIHRSKGLEFPAVILPEMNARIKPNTLSISHGKIMENGKIEVSITLDEMGESKKTNLLQAIKNQAKAEEEAEDKRLFYVAVTRAKYKIAFLADFYENQKNSANWWQKYIVPVYELSDNFREDKNYYDEKRKTEICFCSLEKLKEKFPLRKSEGLKWQTIPEQRNFPKYLEISPHDIMKSVSQKGEKKSSVISDDNLALKFGIIFHKVMEKGWFDTDKFKSEIMEYSALNFPEISFDSVYEKLKQQTTAFKNSEIYRKISEISEREKFPELPVIGWMNNGETFLQVSGVIDLFYKYKNRWFILDYKTDKNKDKLTEYTIQLQTYQWIVKQLFGIEAEAEIYFSALETTEKIKWSDDYFRHIFPDEKKSFQPILPTSFSLPPELTEIISRNEKLMIINPTKQQNINFLKAMAKSKLFRPDIQLFTFNEFVENMEISGRKISPDFVRLLIGKICETKNFSEGALDLLTEAILENERWKVGFVSEEYGKIEEEFRKIKSEQNYFTVADKMEKLCAEPEKFRDTTIVLNGFYRNSPLEFRLMQNISNAAKKFFFIDNFDENRLKKEFSYSHTIWENQKGKPENSQDYKVCFSIRQEVEQVALHILKISDWRRKIEKIKIAVSSLEKYTPVIRRIFRDYGIPVRFLQNKALLSFPMSQLFISYLNLITTQKIKWNDVFAVLLHPLMQPETELFELQIYYRGAGKIYFDKTDEYLLQFPEIKEKIEKIIFSDSETDIFSTIFSFLKKFARSENRELTIVTEKLLSLVKNLQNYYSLLEIEPQKTTLKKDLLFILQKAEIHPKKHEFGIEIMGFLDTLDLQPEKLFLLGLNEGSFPISKPTNPFLNPLPNYSWFISMQLLLRWNALGNKVKYFAAERDVDGTSLQISTLLENFHKSEENLSDLEYQSLRNSLKKYYGKKILNFPYHKQIIRHNALLDESISEFSGKTEKIESNKLFFSSSSFDKLLQCPMKYWFAEILKIKQIDYDEDKENRRILGNILHKSLEKFGKAGGFRKLREDFSSACLLLEEKLRESFDEYKINPDENLLLKNLYKIYRNNLHKENSANLLVRLLKWNLEKFSDFKDAFFEQKFGMKNETADNWDFPEIGDDKIKLLFRGIIDKIFIFPENQIIATDYKTGKFDFKEIIEKTNSQFVIYLLALQKHFPNFKIKIAVEQIKSLRKAENGLSTFLEIREDTLFVPSGKTFIEIPLSELKEHFLNVAEKIIAGNFGVASKELRRKVCEYCEYKSICRKDSQF